MNPFYGRVTKVGFRKDRRWTLPFESFMNGMETLALPVSEVGAETGDSLNLPDSERTREGLFVGMSGPTRADAR